MTPAALAPVIRGGPWWAAIEPDPQWAARLVDSMPMTWAGRLLSRWRERHRIDRRSANLEHLRACRLIEAAQRAGVRADASDADLCKLADESARDAERRIRHVQSIAGATLGELPQDRRERLTMIGAAFEVLGWLQDLGLSSELRAQCGRGLPGALRRVVCARWWRRVLRRLHARSVEATARSLGLVHKHAGCYVSDDGMRARRGQLARNDAALQSVHAINEHGQDFTLAELAARGPANREIRRHELMTRIAGFELIARECGHVALFVTVTCPSRMHAMRTTPGGRVESNPRFDGTAPDAAQRHLSTAWARFRAAADRAGLGLYGFRIAEPNHDGTPHWHALIFFPASTTPKNRRQRARPGVRVAVRLLRRYFLWQVDPGEHGARRHRVKVERIDWTRGSAAGYVAKYVSKNIDGHHVGRDLYGNDAFTSSQRVEAWASRWRVRQFQQVGGPPVGVWRELRRVHPEQAEAAAAVALALEAVNITAGADRHVSDLCERYTAATGWATYTALQGGPRVLRSMLRVRLHKQAQDATGRYGEPMAPRAAGVETVDTRRTMVPAFGIIPAKVITQRVNVSVESERARWLVVPRVAIEPARASILGRRAALPPWTRVNNCTGVPSSGNPYADSMRPEHRPKLGRWAKWDRGGTMKDDHEHSRRPEHPTERHRGRPGRD